MLTDFLTSLLPLIFLLVFFVYSTYIGLQHKSLQYGKQTFSLLKIIVSTL